MSEIGRRGRTLEEIFSAGLRELFEVFGAGKAPRILLAPGRLNLMGVTWTTTAARRFPWPSIAEEVREG